MSPLVQIIYISRTTSVPNRPENGLDPAVARILAKSRANNRQNGLVGVLYFGDGCFFQCLEGDEAAIDTLYSKLEQDPRHKDLKIISRKFIAAPSFQNWSMKYVPVEHSMSKMLLSKGMTTFDPYQFDDTMTQGVIELLLSASEPAQSAEPAAPVVQTAPKASAPPQRDKSGDGAVKLALGVAAIAAAGGLLFAFLPG